ncbi:Tripartite-type tricarboxylate transporter, receptor component TctC [Noviherbaspirillum humi]|uniref:Tripartite-type tricarboxylate transporter, receptor component TctC n=1 Tax=Noviherbaspirillum humi TaxID=1688639 RepID=A0A239K6U1_9BURK|nr:tripartite tricarboxylate transporter substrate binding protein [Noviherbaspirillum humi]SNT12894.1 Tripartite-type tricarboxylate transporter, receptor component TctC [Noviherbaspirillum humi]
MSIPFTRRRTVLLLAGLLASAASLPGAALAQGSYPAKPITIIVPFTPGTGIDVLARAIGPKLSQRLGQPVIVDNRPGASGNIGSGFVANAAPDGYTLLMTVNTLVMNATLYKSVPYDPVKSFVPIAPTAVGALTFAVNPDFPAKTLKEAIKQIKDHPGKFSYSSPGNGTPQHLAMELFKLNTGTDLLHVPYKGSAGAITDLIGGQVQAMILPVHSALTHAKSGKLRMLAVAQDKRVPSAPDVPTFAEQGVQNSNVDLWYGLMAPAGTPADIVNRLNGEINQILAMPEMRETLDKQGMVPTPGKPEVLGNLVKQDYVRWADVIKRAKITAD